MFGVWSAGGRALLTTPTDCWFPYLYGVSANVKTFSKTFSKWDSTAHSTKHKVVIDNYSTKHKAMIDNYSTKQGGEIEVPCMPSYSIHKS